MIANIQYQAMSNLSLQLPSEYTTPHFTSLQNYNSAFPWPREHDNYANFSSEPHSEIQPDITEQSTLYLNHSSGYVPIHNKIYFSILKAAKNYDERLSFLKEEGNLDGVSLNPDSISGFMKFIEKYIPTIRGGLVLIDNGNLRAVWHSDCESFVGIQFLTHELTEYVLFSKTSPSLPVSRSFGQANIDSVLNQIEALELNWMLYEQPQNFI